MAKNKKPTKARVTLTGISSRAWEHPADRGALVALRKLRGFDQVLKAMSGFMREHQERLLLIGSSVRVDERQFARLHRLLAEAATALDAKEVPEMFVQASPVLQAQVTGFNKPIIVISSEMVNTFDEEELRFVIGHELGHAMSGHALYKTMLSWLMGLSGLLTAIPGGALGVRGLLLALREWDRKSELSADRAGLLATQDPAAATRVHMKLASGGQLDELDATSFFAQGAEYDGSVDIRDSLVKLNLLFTQTHPFAVVRASELRNWIDSGAYTKILGGAYPKRQDDAEASVSEAAQEAADGYSQAFAKTQDVLGKLIHDLAGYAGSAKMWFDERFRKGDAP